jgi:Leucine-rich repeat (LRR) protein
LPDTLPSSLIKLDCNNNQLTSLPHDLPSTLIKLDCNNNQLTSLSNNLPSSLQELYCNNNQMTTLPDHLPSSLQKLHCWDNQIQVLPNIPDSVVELYAINNPLTQVYKDIDFRRFLYSDDIKKINDHNSKTRTQARCRQINQHNVLLEIYMKKMMHPDRLHQLRDDESMDVDEFMEKYVQSL